MKEKRVFKWLAVSLLAAAAILMTVVPASAATRRRATKVLKAGQCYHVMNNDIGTNKITSYTVYITPTNTRSRFDAVIASYPSGKSSQPTEYMVRSVNKVAYVNNSAGTFVKSSASSNVGMLACVKVTRGSATIRVDYTTQNGKKGITFVQQSGTHQPMKYIKLKKGKSVNFTMTGSNLTGTPLILSGKYGSVLKRTVGSKSYEQYTFQNSSMAYCVYSNGKIISSYTKNKAYTNRYSSLKYFLMNAPKRVSNWIQSTNSTVNIFYPVDYVAMQIKTK